MSAYHVAVAVHLVAAALWLGHMFVWSLFAGPALKTIEPAEEAAWLRARMLFFGGLGWPALILLVPSGLYLLWLRGVGPYALITLDFLDRPDGPAIFVKLVLVLWMIVYQAVWGHRPAPVAVWVNMAAALGVLACSVAIVRGWA
ncbi:MAG: hypothetical protein N2038_04735 [Geminicoccaceae bacterium]|nr:hypothetical protein [Geminicoccaceae bacterium]MCS7268468.1 hypothetical protein [Geminicoccaceae bacterium]MCX7629539.1 hypothetical protein [Geminicoccaceae bacterium]MDW8126012.1 hypothetical protein [Geminicoccaceae bacterium]MDW8340870.1 hypothetical protein [Geminicoccaceae bacterium]